MNDISPQKTTDWKDRYFKCLLEIEAKERVLSRRDAKALADLKRLCRALASSNQTLAQQARLLEDATVDADVAWNECMEEILSSLAKVQTSAAGSNPVLTRISAVLRQLLETVDVSTEVLPEWRAVQSALVASPTLGTIEKSVVKIAQWIEADNLRRSTEQRESTRYLQRVSSELVNLQQHIVTVNGIQTESLEATAQLQEHIQLDVDTLRSSAESATSLDALRGVIDGRLQAIQKNMKVFFEVEQQRHGSAMNASESLHKRLDELTDETKRLRESLKETTARIYLDALTGIANRLSYDERIAQEYARWQRYGGHLSLMIVDIDHFKSVNDRFGHSTGDALLRTIASVMRQQLRAVDFIARYGGEEFVVLMPETALGDASKVAEKLRTSVENCRHSYKKEPFIATISCGIAEFRTGDATDQVFQRADNCLYLAKRKGRNRVVLDPS